MPDPVSWMMIEPGWTVVDSGGEDVGTIEEVLGDPDADIFSGLIIHTGLLARKYAPSELVGEIVEGRVQLLSSKDEVDALAESAH
jgi:hypothetical protein